jgi:alpha-glucoside transport system substrate-binding protein
MAQGAYLTAHTGVNIDLYADEALKRQGEILQDATVFRFDASDLMPSEIGAGAFWSGMVDYVTGAEATDVAAEIQQRWDGLN